MCAGVLLHVVLCGVACGMLWHVKCDAPCAMDVFHHAVPWCRLGHVWCCAGCHAVCIAVPLCCMRWAELCLVMSASCAMPCGMCHAGAHILAHAHALNSFCCAHMCMHAHACAWVHVCVHVHAVWAWQVRFNCSPGYIWHGSHGHAMAMPQLATATGPLQLWPHHRRSCITTLHHLQGWMYHAMQPRPHRSVSHFTTTATFYVLRRLLSGPFYRGNHLQVRPFCVP